MRRHDQAKADLKTARDCLEDGNYYAYALFAQQSIKKALTGFLYSNSCKVDANISSRSAHQSRSRNS
ncbi:MAG: HEPN domain-containing protein [Candidatus Bathyarchaeia archaeon]